MCLLTQVATYRYNMYVVFMSVPVALIRTLATKRLNLTEDGEEEEDDGFLTAGALGGGQQAPPEDNQPTKGGWAWVDSRGRGIGWGWSRHLQMSMTRGGYPACWGWPTCLRVSQGPILNLPLHAFPLSAPPTPGPSRVSPLHSFFLHASLLRSMQSIPPACFPSAGPPPRPKQSAPPACFLLTGPPPRPKQSVSFGAKAHHDEETAGLVSGGLDKSASMGPLRAQASQSSFFGSLAFWRSSAAQVAPTSKRHLAPSLGPQVGACACVFDCGLGGGVTQPV